VNRPIDQVKRVSWALGPQCPSLLVRESTYALYLLVTVSWRHTLGHSYLEFALPTARHIPTWIEGIKAQGFPEFLGQHLSNVAVDYQNGIFAGNNDLVERIGGKKPTTVQEFITDHLAAFTS
jgi:hypothetical protein